jgi:ABC-type lipoprotein release transport system permease subunit
MRRWIERQRYFVDLTLSSLLRRKRKNLSLVAVFALIVFLIASVLFLSRAIRLEALALLSDAPEIVIQHNVAGRHDLIPIRYAEKIKAIRGVDQVESRLWGYYYHAAARATYTVMASAQADWDDEEVVIGAGVSRTWGTIVDQTLYFKAFDDQAVAVRIKRVLDARTDLVSADLVLMTPRLFRRLFGIPEELATDLVAGVRNVNESPTIAGKILAALPDTRPILREEIHRTYNAVFDWRSGYVLVLLVSAAAAFIIFAWDKASGLSERERKEIGILKALGWDTADILALKFWEGAVICLSAFLLGATGAFVHVFWGDARLFEHALRGWSVLFPTFHPVPDIRIGDLAVLFFLTVVPYTLCTIVPAWQVAATDPDAVMRQS